jgi:Na+-driven multidrug efflux pump
MKLSPLKRTVLGIAAPAVVELILTSLTSLADTIMVGKLGPYAISAVGLTTQPRFVMLAVFVALNVGATVLEARFRGEGNETSPQQARGIKPAGHNKADAELVTVQAILLTALAAIAITVPGVLFA